MARWTRRLGSLIVSALIASSTAGAETLHGKGNLTIPPPGQSTTEAEVVPLTRLEGEAIAYAWRLEVRHSVSTDSRDSLLVLFQQYRVAEGAELSARVDFAFYDEQGRLLHSFETSEYSVTSTEADDPELFPTWNVFEATDAVGYGLPLEDFDAIRSYQVVLRTK